MTVNGKMDKQKVEYKTAIFDFGHTEPDLCRGERGENSLSDRLIHRIKVLGISRDQAIHSVSKAKCRLARTTTTNGGPHQAELVASAVRETSSWFSRG
jgi:hypothetical protein